MKTTLGEITVLNLNFECDDRRYWKKKKLGAGNVNKAVERMIGREKNIRRRKWKRGCVYVPINLFNFTM